jgi:hypothetical protein
MDPALKMAILEMDYPHLLMIHSQRGLTKEAHPPSPKEKSLPTPTMVPFLVLRKAIHEKGLPN